MIYCIQFHSQSYGGSILALAQSVISCVKLLCEWLTFIEPPKLTEAVYEFRRACKVAIQSKFESSSVFLPEVCTPVFLSFM